VRLRGTVQAVTLGTLTIKERSGEVIELLLADKMVISEVYPIKLEDIQPGSFIGTAAMPQADGRQHAKRCPQPIKAIAPWLDKIKHCNSYKIVSN
jgi:hypothetical protein